MVIFAKEYKTPHTIAEYEHVKIRRNVQGKPDEQGLLFSEWSLVGNAVPPLMARAIATTILEHIK